MEKVQKDILVLMLNINLKLINKDSTCVNDINSLLLIAMTENEKQLAYGNLESKFLEIAENNYLFIESVISNSNLENKLYLLMKCKGKNVLRNISQYNLEDYVTLALNTIYTGITPRQEFDLYQMLARLAIMEGSPELIQLTINKIQLL
ncbi:hypothetical protein [Clostridium sp.]|uniref:hypothetical protein n=1 Tax=Clostridium sp. TaxID=1506 RepID=UPI001A492226|nr:hypothetical protein [Clostridium sp.]MBK5239838.1 hypothetical protein [Clostridium sp.]